jgi:serine/threonine-protein kinase
MGVGQVLIILDACRNNPSAARGNEAMPLTEAYAHSFSFDKLNSEVVAFITLYATEVGQMAYEYKDRRQGYFTWGLIEGLSGGAANEKGQVTLAGLIKYLQDIVPKRVSIDLGGNSRQRPFAIVEGYKAEELIIAVSPARPMIPSSNTETQRSSIEAQRIDPAVDERAFWETIKNSKNGDAFKAYLQQYPNGRFAKLARISLDEIYARYGAIAFSQASGRVGYSIDQSTRDLAEKKALDSCYANDCRVRIWFKNACAAFARNSAKGKTGWAWAKSKSNAEYEAIKNCHNEIDPRILNECSVAFSICTSVNDDK